jgi:hypothetical protein
MTVMASRTQRVVALICAGALSACTSLQHLPESASAGASRAHRQAHSVAIGDALRITPKDAAAFELTVTSVTPDSISGTRNGQERQILLIEVESIEKKRFDVLRTALLVGSLVLVALGQYARGVSKLANP